jgi:hypothetical protein
MNKSGWTTHEVKAAVEQMSAASPELPTLEGRALADWQKIRYGDDDAARASLAHWRERGWDVDNQLFDRQTDEREARIYAFMAGYKAAHDALGQQLSAHRAENAHLRDRVEELEEAIRGLRPTSAGHDCPWCEDWDGESHGEDCILRTTGRAAARSAIPEAMVKGGGWS